MTAATRMLAVTSRRGPATRARVVAQLTAKLARARDNLSVASVNVTGAKVRAW